jgi:hypothetical protein
MSNLFDSRLQFSEDSQTLHSYVALRVGIEDETKLEGFIHHQYLAEDCECDSELVPCLCSDKALAEGIKEVISPVGAVWSEEALIGNEVEVVFEIEFYDPLQRLNDAIPGDRDHWLALLCAYLYEFYFDRDSSFYEERGLKFLSFAASDNLYEISNSYA